MPSRVPQLTQIQPRIIYSDITLNLDIYPQTGDLQKIYNAQAVVQSIRNIVLTYPGERYYNLLLGSTVSRDLYEFADQFTMDRIQQSLQQTISSYEPRAQNVQISVQASPVNNYVNVDIVFQIAIAPGQAFSVPTIVLRIR